MQRTWELYLGALLLEHGYPLEKPPSDGPDLKIRRSERPVWIEAVAPQAGTGADKAERMYSWKQRTPYGFRATFKVDKDKTVLRYTHALEKKRQQLQQFQQRNIVAGSEPVVVAISGAAIEDADLCDDFPDILRAVYGIDETVLHVPVGASVEPWESVTTRKEVNKAAGAPVGVTAFVGNNCRDVSAVLFSPDALCAELSGQQVITVHNLRAQNPLERGFFRFGLEYWIDEQTGQLRSQDYRALRGNT
ncbi:MAG: hypothetical protein R3B13_01870 [Polyangiaceae bacterium]